MLVLPVFTPGALGDALPRPPGVALAEKLRWKRVERCLIGPLKWSHKEGGKTWHTNHHHAIGSHQLQQPCQQLYLHAPLEDGEVRPFFGGHAQQRRMGVRIYRVHHREHQICEAEIKGRKVSCLCLAFKEKGPRSFNLSHTPYPFGDQNKDPWSDASGGLWAARGGADTRKSRCLDLHICGRGAREQVTGSHCDCKSALFPFPCLPVHPP